MRARSALAALGAATALTLAAAGPASPAESATTVRIVSLRVLVGSGPRVAKGPLRLDRSYSYRVEYVLGGSGVMRVTRAATVLSPEGVVALVRPPASISDPGRYRVTSRIRVGPEDPPGLYGIRYTIVARGADRKPVRREKEILVRFVAPPSTQGAPVGG
jgi:hypothetical protein